MNSTQHTYKLTNRHIDKNTQTINTFTHTHTLSCTKVQTNTYTQTIQKCGQFTQKVTLKT